LAHRDEEGTKKFENQKYPLSLGLLAVSEFLLEKAIARINPKSN
jgi:hypothetical protein